MFDAQRLRLVNSERIGWHDAKLQKYRLAANIQSLLSRSEIHKVHVGQHLLFGEITFFVKTREEIRAVRWQRPPFTFSGTWVPMKQSALCAICEALVDSYV